MKKNEDRLTGRLNMTIAVDWDVKQQELKVRSLYNF